MVVLAACNAKQAPPKQEVVAPAKAADATPAVPDGGAAESIPSWANDPPHVLRDKINDVNAHIIVLKSTAFAEYRDVLKVVEGTPGVTAAEPFIFAELQITAGKVTASLALKGVDPARVQRVLRIGRRMKTGSLDSLAKGEPPPIVLGDVLAQKLGVAMGDDVTVSALKDTPDPVKPTVFRVAGTFHMEFDEYDERLGLASIASVQAMLDRGDLILGIEAIVKDLDQSDEIAKAIEDKLGALPYEVQDWYELNQPLYNAMYGDRRP